MKTQHRRTVVAIDDDEINLSILSKCAQDAGFKVETFDSTLAGWNIYAITNKRWILF